MLARRPLAWPLAAIAALVLALYARTATFGFTYLDDDALILEQQAFLSQPSSLWRAFARPYFPSAGRDHAYYRPLVTASFAADARWAGAGAGGHHFTNVVLHALAACLLYLLLLRLGHGSGVALFGGLVFAAHPALTEAVAWIPGRNDLLLVVFALAAWLLFLRAFEPGRWGSRIAHPLAWLAALCSKEAALVLPLVLAAHHGLVERRPWRQLRAPWLLVGWSGALAVYAAARVAALPDKLGAAGVSAARALANAPTLLASSLGKLAFPTGLSVLATPEDSPVLPGALAAAALFAALFVPRIRRPALLFALGAFVVFVAPSLPASTLLALESRLALPAVAFVLAACELARRAAWPPRLRLAAGGAIVAALAAVSFVYAGDFRDRLTFSRAAVRGSPHASLAHRNLGVALQLAGESESAAREYEAALAEDAAEPVAHNNLAVILMRQGRLVEAEQHLRAELAVNPRYADAHANLALVLGALGRQDEAAAQAREAQTLAGDPGR